LPTLFFLGAAAILHTLFVCGFSNTQKNKNNETKPILKLCIQLTKTK